jgi:hypothetical protein
MVPGFSFKQWERARQLADAPRDIRIASLTAIPNLISSLKSRAERDTRTIQDTKKLLGW